MVEWRMKRWGESTNRIDEVVIGEVANPVNAGDDRDRLFRKIKDLLSELLGFVSGVFGGHGGEEEGTGWNGWVQDSRFYSGELLGRDAQSEQMSLTTHAVRG